MTSFGSPLAMQFPKYITYRWSHIDGDHAQVVLDKENGHTVGNETQTEIHDLGPLVLAHAKRWARPGAIGGAAWRLP